MLMMLIGSIPLDKTDETTETLLKLRTKGRPSYIKIVDSYLWLDGDQKIFQIVEIEKGHEDEGLKFLGMLPLAYRHIEGVKMAFYPVSTLEEALAAQGVKLPKG